MLDYGGEWIAYETKVILCGIYVVYNKHTVFNVYRPYVQ